MSYCEHAEVFFCAGQALTGIATIPDLPCETGVLIVVGGPQYRVGSHRQFVLLARRLAQAGYPAFRFDYRGMGDSDGEMPGFESVNDDIRAAMDVFVTVCPGVRRVVLWGLCDAASASLLYVESCTDVRIGGLVLLNPWVRSDMSLAQAQIKHYYLDRVRQKSFWVKLLRGDFKPFASLRDFLANLIKACQRKDSGRSSPVSFQDRMGAGLQRFPGEILLLLSGRDYTAREFIEYASARDAWRAMLAGPRVSRVDFPEADHVFSSAVFRRQVEEATLAWLTKIEMPSVGR